MSNLPKSAFMWGSMLGRVALAIVVSFMLVAASTGGATAAEKNPPGSTSSGYVIVDLGVLPAESYSGASSISDRGQIVGETWDGYASFALFWENSLTLVVWLANLPSYPGDHHPQGGASSINERGQIVGSSSGSAALWEKGVVTNLGGPANAYLSAAASINDRGQIVGYSSVGETEHAVLWDRGAVIDLGAVPGASYSLAADINERGQIVGTSGLLSSGDLYARAALWDQDRNRNTLTDLGTLPGATGSAASSINNQGQVVGSSGGHAALWDTKKRTVTDLGTLPGASNSAASSINNRGQIVGSSGGHAVLWEKK